MELAILHWIQALRMPLLDWAMTGLFNDFVGSKSELWIVAGILLLIVPKTRKCGVCLLSAYVIAYFIGDGLLKGLIARPRPYVADPNVALMISVPASYSCPSLHTMLAFAATGAIMKFNKGFGIAVMIFAVMVGVSRMYFFVSYPADVLVGGFLGFWIGKAVSSLFKKAT